MDNNIIDKRTKGEWTHLHHAKTRSGNTLVGIKLKSFFTICEVSAKFPFTFEESEANAAFIVKACNEYDKLKEQRDILLEALKNSYDMLVTLHNRGEDFDSKPLNMTLHNDKKLWDSYLNVQVTN